LLAVTGLHRFEVLKRVNGSVFRDEFSDSDLLGLKTGENVSDENAWKLEGNQFIDSSTFDVSPGWIENPIPSDTTPVSIGHLDKFGATIVKFAVGIRW
jgi:hypothetical protein